MFLKAMHTKSRALILGEYKQRNFDVLQSAADETFLILSSCVMIQQIRKLYIKQSLTMTFGVKLYAVVVS